MKRANGNQAKAELKAAGIDTRKVRIHSSTSGQALNVSINDVSLSRESVEAVLKKHETIQRCEATGEILSGGNFFVFVQYDWSSALPESFVDAFQLACAQWDRLPDSIKVEDNNHFCRSMVRENPEMTESQAAHTIRRCLSVLANA